MSYMKEVQPGSQHFHFFFKAASLVIFALAASRRIRCSLQKSSQTDCCGSVVEFWLQPTSFSFVVHSLYLPSNSRAVNITVKVPKVSQKRKWKSFSVPASRAHSKTKNGFVYVFLKYGRAMLYSFFKCWSKQSDMRS